MPQNTGQPPLTIQDESYPVSIGIELPRGVIYIGKGKFIKDRREECKERRVFVGERRTREDRRENTLLPEEDSIDMRINNGGRRETPDTIFTYGLSGRRMERYQRRQEKTNHIVWESYFNEYDYTKAHRQSQLEKTGSLGVPLTDSELMKSRLN